MLSLIDDLRAHMARMFATAPVLDDPFPHLVVPGLFPDRDYATLLASLPAPGDWQDAGRHRCNFEIETDTSSEPVMTVWRRVHCDVAPLAIMPLVLEALRPHLTAYWAGRGIEGPGLEPSYRCEQGRLLLRYPGYRLAPHLDPNEATITALLYLARDGDDDRYGTDLYRGTPPRTYDGIFKADTANLDYSLARTIPFRPNTLLAFLTPLGLHGATFPDHAVFERYSYQFLVCLDTVTRREIGERERAFQRREERRAVRRAAKAGR